MSVWKFQVIANEPNVVGLKRLMDDVANSVAEEVNDALRYPFEFHKVNKIVLCLGKGTTDEKEYKELLGVGHKQWPDFDLHAYAEMAEAEKIEAIRAVVLDTFRWLEDNFVDAQFVSIGRRNLKWASE